MTGAPVQARATPPGGRIAADEPSAVDARIARLTDANDGAAPDLRAWSHRSPTLAAPGEGEVFEMHAAMAWTRHSSLEATLGGEVRVRFEAFLPKRPSD